MRTPALNGHSAITSKQIKIRTNFFIPLQQEESSLGTWTVRSKPIGGLSSEDWTFGKHHRDASLLIASLCDQEVEEELEKDQTEEKKYVKTETMLKKEMFKMMTKNMKRKTKRKMNKKMILFFKEFFFSTF